MCEIVTLTAIAGSLATAAGSASTLAAVGAAVGIAGSVMQGIQSNSAAKAEAAQIEQQRKTEAELNNVKDLRLRDEFAREISRQRLGLAGAGVSLDSPSSLLLGRQAAAEMSFDSQSIRSTGQAVDQELSFAARSARTRGRNAMVNGMFNAGSIALSAAPKIFPGLDNP